MSGKRTTEDPREIAGLREGKLICTTAKKGFRWYQSDGKKKHFTIRHPRTGQIYYWEHFGRMDDSVYAKKAGSKLQMYISSGIIPSIQLITTYETLDSPLDMEVIEKILHRYFHFGCRIFI